MIVKPVTVLSRSGAEAVGLAVWSIGCGDSWFFRQEKVTLFFDFVCLGMS